MKVLFDEFGDGALSTIVSILILSLFLGILFSGILPIGAEVIETNVNDKVVENDKIVSIKEFIVKDGTVKQGNQFNYQDRVMAKNSRDEEINNFVHLSTPIDTTTIGEKEVTYVLRYNGEKRIGKAKVFVEALEEENEEYS